MMIRLWRMVWRQVLIAGMILFASRCCWAGPPQRGMVLWLDADAAESVHKDAEGRISRWADRSGQAHDAVQAEAKHRPRWESLALGGRPVAHFDGNQFLNLGRPDTLEFRPGQPLTIAVVSNVAAKGQGTFLAKGGGAAGSRSYQLYAASGRIGSVTYGVMRENREPAGPKVMIQVCDGKQVQVLSDGETSLSFAGAKGASNVDVLVGARRENSDNTGTAFLLVGDIAEIMVFDRALALDELNQLGSYFNEKYSLDGRKIEPMTVARLLDTIKKIDGNTRLDGLVVELVRLAEDDLPQLERAVRDDDASALVIGELLIHAARQNQLSAPLATLAGEMLGHDDAFVRGMAEWALSMKVGGENNGQQCVWPGEDKPDWYAAWTGLEADRRLEADWVRQAVATGVHRDAGKLAASVDGLIERVEKMREGFTRHGADSGTLKLVESRLADLKAIRAEMDGTTATVQRRQWLQARAVLRDVVLANPAINFDQVVCVKQFAPHTVRNITRSYSWKHKPGGDIAILSEIKSVPKAANVLQGRLGPGFVWGLDLWWDADRLVFSYARQPNWPPKVNTANYAIEGTNVFTLRTEHEPLHLFEVRTDGSGLRQVTDDPYWSDFEPTYSPNGEIVFASDRCGRAAECGNDTYDHTNPNLYVVSADGRDLRKWTDSKDIDRYPHSLDDGRIAYTHWEYQERHFMEVHALWTARPDGTMSDALFKHHMPAPCGLRDTRSVPESTKLISIATGHHTFAYGPVVLVDPGQGMNNQAGLSIVTPGVRPQEGAMSGSPVAEGGVVDAGGLYQTPWALSETCMLAAYSYARPNCTAPAGVDSNGFGVYVIDVYGNRELLHRDPLLSCAFPIPLAKRNRPPILAEPSEEPASYGTCYVSDVYDGMRGVPRGTIKYLRIAQHVGWPFDPVQGQMDYIAGNAGQRRFEYQSWSPVRVIGTVPVEADGSANFKAPADTALYFQALDGREMEVVRMRSMVSLKAGEVRGCRGCHESEAKAPVANFEFPLAAKRPPSVPEPPSWGSEKTLGYEWLIQPILDRHCVACHGEKDPDGGLDFTDRKGPDGLCQSYRTMFGALPGKKALGPLLVSCSDRFSNSAVTQPMQFGSHKSPLIRVLLDDELHKKEVCLDSDEWRALVTWVDANAPYHDGFLNKRPADGAGPCREIVKRFMTPIIEEE